MRVKGQGCGAGSGAHRNTTPVTAAVEKLGCTWVSARGWRKNIESSPSGMGCVRCKYEFKIVSSFACRPPNKGCSGEGISCDLSKCDLYSQRKLFPEPRQAIVLMLLCITNTHPLRLDSVCVCVIFHPQEVKVIKPGSAGFAPRGGVIIRG